MDPNQTIDGMATLDFLSSNANNLLPFEGFCFDQDGVKVHCGDNNGWVHKPHWPIDTQRPESIASIQVEIGLIWVYHTKVLSGTPKERNQWAFLWSKVFLDKGITNRTIGRI